MFVVNLHYIVSQEVVNATREDHIKFLDKFYKQNKFLVSGRKYDGNGGVILVNSDSIDEVEGIMNQDPFIINKVAKYEIIGFNPTKKSLAASKFFVCIDLSSNLDFKAHIILFPSILACILLSSSSIAI